MVVRSRRPQIDNLVVPYANQHLESPKIGAEPYHDGWMGLKSIPTVNVSGGFKLARIKDLYQ
jgi:hypothetical protein